VVIAKAGQGAAVLDHLNAAGENACVIGEVVARPGRAMVDLAGTLEFGP
jgi:hypothetical protein